DMPEAVDRINQAIKANEEILIYGDYDVDGATAVSLVYRVLERHHKNIRYYIPDRYKEGYGISQQGVEWARDNNVKLIIALDCGIKAAKLVRLAKSFGIDFIIGDHHLPDDDIPPAVAVLDPKQTDCNYPYEELSGCGIGFKLMQAWTASNNISEDEVLAYLDLVAVSIASDIVPITGENRVLAAFGIKKLQENPSPGLSALMKKAGMDGEITVTDILFGIGPRINAAGRMDDATDAVRLLTALSEEEAEEDAELLNERNAARKLTDKQITTEALEMIAEWPDGKTKFSTVICNPGWHKGVIGIVASRLIETYHRPTIVLTIADGMATGSARSIRGFDVHAAICECADLLDRFGGHKYAAGLSMKEENLEAFISRFEEIVKATIDPTLLIPELRIDAELNLTDIKDKFFGIIKQFGPFGPGNMSPVFTATEVKDSGWSKIVKEEHLKLSVIQKVKSVQSGICSGIAFGKATDFKYVHTGKPFDIAYQLKENTWNGATSLQLQVKDIQHD
ncbi:MAG: single-stranded-DNA-specific exonuclease, partial [Limisphaerales bacterium]